MRRSSSARLSVQVLEGREVPAVVISQPAPDTLVFIGDGASDTIVLRDNGVGGISGSATGAGAFSFTGIRNIRIATNGGNDAVSYTLFNNLAPNQARNISVDLGSSPWWGSDRFNANLFNPFTGVGSDLLTGSALTIYAFGGEGRDQMFVNASRDTDVAAGARLNMILSGGSGSDTIRADWYGENDGGVFLREDGGTGNDSIRGRLQEAAGSTGQLSAAVYGRDGIDNLGLSLFTTNVPVLALLDGGAGFDVAFSTANVTQVNVP